MNMRRLSIAQVMLGVVIWLVCLGITFVFVATARFAEQWDTTIGFWAWAVSWAAVCVFLVWLTDDD